MRHPKDFPFTIYHFSFANSIWKCNELLFEKYFVWRSEAKRFSRSIVQSSRHRLHVLRRDPGEVIFLGKILSDQSVSVFVETTFPTAIGMAEIDLGLQHGGDIAMIGELFAVIDGDGMHQFRARRQQLNALTFYF